MIFILKMNILVRNLQQNNFLIVPIAAIVFHIAARQTMFHVQHVSIYVDQTWINSATFANSLDKDQARQKFRPDIGLVGPNC